jgi:Rrf2 family protein
VRLELTRRADYAVRATLALARAPEGDLLSVHRIAADETIPAPFLSQVMSDLVRAGLVDASPGRSGGYRLTRPASDISLLDVVTAVEGDSGRQTCVLRSGPCGAHGECDVHAVFFAAHEGLMRTLSDATLESVVAPR